MINNPKPLNNKAIAHLPSWINIKTIVALSALENDVWIQKDIRIVTVKQSCTEKISLLEKKGHGTITRTAIQKSCDVYFYEVARLLKLTDLP